MSGISSIPGAWSAPWVPRIHWSSESVSHQLPGVGLESQPQRRTPLAASPAAVLTGAAAAGCSSGSAPAGNGQEVRSEAPAEPAPANAAAAAPVPAAAAPASLAAAPAARAARRCGWLVNPTPANWWLTDSEGQWILATQGADQAPGMDEMPDMSTAGWVETNGHYGYGCACMTIEADADGTVTRVADAQPKPLRQCRSDRKLPRPE